MIKFQATAKVHSVSGVLEIPSKSGGAPFQKRELVLDDSYTKDGQTYSSYVLVEFTGERMQSLDMLAPGMLVNVEGVINGREHNGKYYNTVKGLSAVPHQAQQQYAPPAAYPQQPAQYPPQQSYPPQSAPAPGYPQQFGAPQYPPQGYNPNQQYVPGNPIGNPYPGR